MFAKNERNQVSSSGRLLPLKEFKILSLAINLPGPLAASRLANLGAGVIKIEPPEGDPLAHYSPEWYQELAQGQEIMTLDLKDKKDRRHLDELLERSDILLTSMRLEALQRLKLNREGLDKKFPSLLQIAITGYQSNSEGVPGHDLTYQAALGLLSPPNMPNTLLTDIAAAERVVSAALSLALERERGSSNNYAEVSIAETGSVFVSTLRYGLTTPNGILGGGFAGYNLYQTAEGWIALAALETRFQKKLLAEFNLSEADYQKFQTIFLQKTAAQWERWAQSRGLPIKVVRD